MNMTITRLKPLLLRAFFPQATPRDLALAERAMEQRRHERGRSKLARRLTRKAALGMSGSF